MKRKQNHAVKFAQQGDLLLIRLDALPDGGMPVDRTTRGFVLAEGEATGHAHAIDSEDAELIRIGERLLLKLFKPATVKHEEHKPIRLEPGVWEIGRVQEYDYLSKMARVVTD